jgi:hypothetical protein
VDSSLFRHCGQWWMMACEGAGNETLRLFSAPELRGPWVEHPQSPVVRGDACMGRPGGRIVRWNDRLIRYAQDCSGEYGRAVRAYEIEELSPTAYREVQLRMVLQASGHGWNANGMHHVDPQPLPDGQWMACVDGCRRPVKFRLKW